MPAKQVPKVDVPLIDKWVHFTFFGGFALFWLFAWPSVHYGRLITIVLLGVFFGCMIEVFQGLLPALGRASELMDAVADSIGAILGVVAFRTLASAIKG